MPGRRSSPQRRPSPPILDAVKAVGDLLEEEGERVGIVVVGGTAMILLGVVTRSTEDVDILAIADAGARGTMGAIRPPDPLPAPLRRAVAKVARDFHLPEDWMNSTVAAQWQTGLPPGLEGRIKWRRFGGLTVGVAHRLDLIFLKLYAAVDSEGPQSVHYQDLLALRPRKRQLELASAWVKGQDTSVEFAHMLNEVLDHVSQDQKSARQ